MNNRDSHCRCGTEGKQVPTDHGPQALPKGIPGPTTLGYGS
jgi:hypothetical protein